MRWPAKYGPLLLPITLLLIARTLLDFNGMFGRDSNSYLQFSTQILASFGEAEISGTYSWPVIYPLLGAVLSWLTTAPVELSLQVISMLGLTGFLWNMRLLLQETWPKRNHQYFWWVLVGLSPYLVRTAMVVRTR